MSQNFFNAATQIVTIYDAEGTLHKATRLNALDLIRTNGFSWSPPGAAVAEAEATPETSAENAPEEEPETAAAENAPEEEPDFDVRAAPLAEVAMRLVGSDDVAKYLNGFTADALRTMAFERYEQNVHHRTSKETIIDKIVVWESEKTSEESSEV
jgi:hypothetical protein